MNSQAISILLLSSSAFCIAGAFDDFPDMHAATPTSHVGPLPKGKVLLESIQELTFHRNKMTTSRRTHSIHQISCIGGTAGCRIFKPDQVDCTRVQDQSSQYDWKCKADISDKVFFNRVEVICEGYDYPEDDYILLGSCGLEYTLDYKDPKDHHPNSYFRHMDDHEQEMYRSQVEPSTLNESNIWDFIVLRSNQTTLVGLFVLVIICSVVIPYTSNVRRTL